MGIRHHTTLGIEVMTNSSAFSSMPDEVNVMASIFIIFGIIDITGRTALHLFPSHVKIRGPSKKPYG